MMLPTLPAVAMGDVIANSFRDFHTKGFDYICLRRSPVETVKLYFFDGDVSKLPEVINPHDHRYAFRTLCVAGAVENRWFDHGGRTDCDPVFTRFEYRTPLLGGSGFTFSGTERMHCTQRQIAAAGERYWMQAHEIHTIRMVHPETVLAIIQYEDVVPDDKPTMTWTRDRYPPSLTGMYRKFDADTIIKRLVALKERVPGIKLPEIV